MQIIIARLYIMYNDATLTFTYVLHGIVGIMKHHLPELISRREEERLLCIGIGATTQVNALTSPLMTTWSTSSRLPTSAKMMW